MVAAGGESVLPALGGGAVRGRQRNLWIDAVRRLVRNRLAVVGLVIISIFITLALSAPIVDRYNPVTYQNYSAIQQGPSWTHFFGTDKLGHDNWSQVLSGLRVSLAVGFSVAAIILVVGVSVGALAALGGHLTDSIVMRAVDVAYAFPDLLLIILIQTIFGGGLWQVILAISLVAWTNVARLVRGQMLSLREADYAMAARTLGATQRRIVFHHILPNTLGPVIVALTFAIPSAIFAEAALAFIGIGLPPPSVSLGRLILNGYDYIHENVWLVLFPAFAIALMMLSFTFVGDGLRDALDPRTRGA